jgi:TonB family protein
MQKATLRSLVFFFSILLLTVDLGWSQSVEPDKDGWVEVTQEPSPIVPIEKFVVYPEDARRYGVEGRVTVSALINEEGKVIKVDLEKSDNELLNEAAISAMRKVTFRPAMDGAKPIKVWYTQTILFRLDPPGPNSPKLESELTLELPTSVLPSNSKKVKSASLIGPQPLLPYTPELSGHTAITLALEIDPSGSVIEIRALEPGVQDKLTTPVLNLLRSLPFRPAEHEGRHVLNTIVKKFTIKEPSR